MTVYRIQIAGEWVYARSRIELLDDISLAQAAGETIGKIERRASVTPHNWVPTTLDKIGVALSGDIADELTDCQSCADGTPGKKVSFEKHAYDYMCDECIDADARAIEVTLNGDFKVKTYQVKHEVRLNGAIGIFTWQSRTIEANSEEEARDKSREFWNGHGYETRAADAEVIHDNEEEEGICTKCGAAPVTRTGTPRLWNGLCEDCYK